MPATPIQALYPDDTAHCFGCGRLNARGHQFRTFWDDDTQKSVTRFTPEPHHTAIPGYVYGGLLASLVDCHGTGTAAIAGYRAEGREPGTEPPLRYVTASLQVDFLKPTPLGPELVARGTIEEIGERKVVVGVTVTAGETVCATGRVVAVRMPEAMSGSNRRRGRTGSPGSPAP